MNVDLVKHAPEKILNPQVLLEVIEAKMEFEMPEIIEPACPVPQGS